MSPGLVPVKYELERRRTSNVPDDRNGFCHCRIYAECLYIGENIIPRVLSADTRYPESCKYELYHR